MSGPFDSLDQVAQVLNTDQVFCLPAKPVKKLVKARQSSQFKFGKKWLSHEKWSELEKAVQNNLKIEDLCGRWTWDFSYTGKRDRSGLSVNSAFKHNVYIKLPTLKEILTVAFDKGLRYGAKCDYENGFRLAKLGPSMRRFGIYQAKGRFYIDLRVSMGHSASPKLYQETTSTIVQAYKRYAITHLGLRTVPHIWVFLDDTMILGKTEQETRFLLTEYMKFTEKLGFKIKASKTVWPTQTIELLGFMCDLRTGHTYISKEKRDRYIQSLDLVLQGQFNLKLLQKLAGKLQFTASPMAPMKAFLPPIYERISMLDQGIHKKFTPLHLLNLRVWKKFLQTQHRSEIAYTLGRLPYHPQEIWTDSSTWGMGAYFAQGAWISEAWHNGPKKITRFMVNIAEEPGITINALEYAAVLIPLYYLTEGAHRIGHTPLRKRFIRIFCDNKATIFWIQKSCARSPLPHVLSLIFEGLAFSYGLRFQIEFVRSEDNKLADALSRARVHKSLKNERRTHIPWKWLMAKLEKPSSVWKME